MHLDDKEFEELNEKLEKMNDEELKEFANIFRATYKYDLTLILKQAKMELHNCEAGEQELLILAEREREALEWQRWIDAIRDRNRTGQGYID